MTQGQDSGRLLAGRYRLSGVVGKGGMGTVWRAADEMLGRTVAVKEVRIHAGIDDEEKRRLYTRTLREAKATALIRHTGAVTIYDVVEEDDRPWIVMELVEARALSDILREDGLLTPRRAAEVGLELLGVLRSAHQHGILHRDVKPSNVLIAENGRVVLTDFGIATVEGDPSVTSTGMLVGAPSYIAPERARGRKPGPASDLWSLGATLFASLEGKAPFDRGTAMATLTAVLTEELPRARRAGALEQVLAGLLVREPEQRLDHGTAERMLRRVADGAAGRDEEQGAVPTLERTSMLPMTEAAEGGGGGAAGGADASRSGASGRAASRRAGRSSGRISGLAGGLASGLSALRGGAAEEPVAGSDAGAGGAGGGGEAASEDGARGDGGRRHAAGSGRRRSGGTPSWAAAERGGSGGSGGGAEVAESGAASERDVPTRPEWPVREPGGSTGGAGSAGGEDRAGGVPPMPSAPPGAPPGSGAAGGAGSGTRAGAGTSASRGSGAPGAQSAEVRALLAAGSMQSASGGITGDVKRMLAGERPTPRVIVVIAIVVLALLFSVLGLSGAFGDEGSPGGREGSGSGSGSGTGRSAASSADGKSAKGADGKPAASPDTAKGKGATGSAPNSPRPDRNRLPSGYAMHKDDSGYRIALPPGFRRTGGTSARDIFTGSGGRRIVVEVTSTPGPSALQAWRDLEPATRSTSPGYQRHGMKNVEYRGWDAADWEFSYLKGGERFRKLDRGFVTDSQHGYAILWMAAEGEWGSAENVRARRALFESFRPDR